MEPKKLTLLSPPAHCCQCCAVAHSPKQAHDATSLFYAFWFQENHGRSPTWNDAIAHCEPAMQLRWIDYLKSMGIDASSTDKLGGIRTQQDLDERFKSAKLE